MFPPQVVRTNVGGGAPAVDYSIMSDLKSTLERLALTFTVRDIIVPKEELVCAGDEASAQELLEENPGFDVIPLVQNGALTAYLERGSEHSEYIRLQDIVSDAISVLDLVDVLCGRRFCFVLVGHSLTGYVHFSDLNNHVVKLPFFVVLEALERQLVVEIGSLIDETNLDKVLDQQRARNVKNKMRNMRKNRANLAWVNLMSFNELIRFALHFGKLQLSGKEIDTISKVRNLVCHASDPLVESHHDVKRLSDAKSICLKCTSSLARAA